MKYTWLPLALIGLMLSGCGSNGSMRPTASIQMDRPLACRVPCLMPPSLAMERNDWEAAVFAWGADCKALHDDCVTAPEKQATENAD